MDIARGLGRPLILISAGLPSLLLGMSTSALGSASRLLDATRHTIVGQQSVLGCQYSFKMTLPAGRTALEERIVSEDPAACEVVVERGTPTLVDDRIPSGSSQQIGSGVAVDAAGPVALAATRSSGYYKTWYEDPPGIDVSGVRSTVTWTWNGSSTSSVTCGFYRWWYTPTGWSITDSASACSNPGQGQSETYGAFENQYFCFPNTTRTYFWPTYAIGRKNGDLVGDTRPTKLGGCTSLLTLRLQLVRTSN